MEKLLLPHHQHQESVNTYFHARSAYWKEIYASGAVLGEVYRKRQATVLTWIEELALAPSSRVLEVGCGAGFLSVMLATSGLCVTAIDSAEAMVTEARRHAQESGTSDYLTVDLGDVYALAFEDASFDLVIAIGVIPWLERPDLAIHEMARVTKPTGHVLITADNQLGLTYLLDPWYTVALRPLRRLVKGVLKKLKLFLASLEVPGAVFHSPRFIDALLADVHLIKAREKTVGFGPFTFFYRNILPDSPGMAIHHRLQSLADRGIPVLRAAGMFYLVLARKPISEI